MFDDLKKYQCTYVKAAEDLEAFLVSPAWEAYIDIKSPKFAFGVSDIPLGCNEGMSLYLYPRFGASALPCMGYRGLFQLLYGVHGRLHRYAPNKSDPAMLLAYIVLSMQMDIATMIGQIEARCGHVDESLMAYARDFYGELNAIVARINARDVAWPESGMKRILLRTCVTWFW